MSAIPFHIPSLEHLSGLLPAYDFDSLIAHGGSGAVYKARQKSLDRDVAVKILPRELVGDSRFRESFAAEAKTMARLAHTNLIKVYDYGDADGMLYLVMEYVHGASLSSSASGMKVDPRQAVEIILKVCRGLSHAHDHGITHRDIKPGNILLTRECEPKIGDFGMARPDGIVIGTHGYAAPEVLGRSEETDHRADIFAIGIILKELLTGIAATDGDFQQISCDDPRLAAICEKATESDPARRYSNIGELCHALESWRQRRPNRLHIPANRPAAAVRGTSVPFRRPSLAPAHTGRTNWKPLKNCALIALLLSAGLLAWNTHRNNQEFIAAQERKKATGQSGIPQTIAAEPKADVWASTATDY